MAKQTSLFGKISGKIGSVVFSTSGGETISREYNPHVANPSTMPQVNQRARMKLMSQLSASLSPVIAMTKDGLVSRRNKFVKLNFDNTYASQGTAQISYENVQITEGSTGLPQVVVNVRVDASGGPAAYLATAPSANISRVVYCVFSKSQENRLQYLFSRIATEKGDGTGASPYFMVDLADLPTIEGDDGRVFDGEFVIYAYGMSDTSEKATARYGNLNVQSASDIATLVANRTISFQDYQFTQTRGVTVGQGTSGGDPTPAGQARVFVTALGNGGSVTGGGTFAIGSQVTVTATPNSGYRFKNWLYNGTNLVASTSASYTFTLNQQVDLIAVFEGDGNESL